MSTFFSCVTFKFRLNCGLKELRSLMDSVLSIDQDLVVEAIRTHALQTLQLYASGTAVKWNDAELAVYLIFIFGEINKSALASPF
jgi:exportin-T